MRSQAGAFRKSASVSSWMTSRHMCDLTPNHTPVCDVIVPQPKTAPVREFRQGIVGPAFSRFAVCRSETGDVLRGDGAVYGFVLDSE